MAAPNVAKAPSPSIANGTGCVPEDVLRFSFGFALPELPLLALVSLLRVFFSSTFLADVRGVLAGAGAAAFAVTAAVGMPGRVPGMLPVGTRVKFGLVTPVARCGAPPPMDGVGLKLVLFVYRSTRQTSPALSILNHCTCVPTSMTRFTGISVLPKTFLRFSETSSTLTTSRSLSTPNYCVSVCCMIGRASVPLVDKDNFFLRWVVAVL